MRDIEPLHQTLFICLTFLHSVHFHTSCTRLRYFEVWMRTVTCSTRLASVKNHAPVELWLNAKFRKKRKDCLCRMGWVLFEEIYRTKSNFSIETHFVWVSSLFHKYPFGDSWRWINCRRSKKRTKINRSKMKTRVLNLKLNSQHPFSQHCIHKHNLSQLTRLLSKFFYLIKNSKKTPFQTDKRRHFLDNLQKTSKVHQTYCH